MKEFIERSFREKINVWRVPGDGLYLYSFDGWLGGAEKIHQKSSQIRILQREIVQKKLKVEKSKKTEDQEGLKVHEAKMDKLMSEGALEEKLGELRPEEEDERDQFFTEFLFP